MTTTRSITEDIFFSLDTRMIVLFYRRNRGGKGFRRHNALVFQSTQNVFQVEKRQVERLATPLACRSLLRQSR
jgi:hypothetical protein